MSQSGFPYADTRNMYAIHTLFRREFGYEAEDVFGTPSVGVPARVGQH